MGVTRGDVNWCRGKFLPLLLNLVLTRDKYVSAYCFFISFFMFVVIPGELLMTQS